MGAEVTGQRSLSAAAARFLPLWIALALLALTLVALSAGRLMVDPGEALAASLRRLTGDAVAPLSREEIVLWNVRLPRVLAALSIGAALAAAGAAYQGLFHNPLASPDILGVSAGASVGAMFGIFLSLPVLAVQGLAFAGGLLAVAVVQAIATFVRQRDPALVLVLGGVAVASLCGATISLLKLLADPYTQLPTMTYWMLGSLSAATLRDVSSTLPALAAGVLVLHLLRWRLTVLSFGDDDARSLGLNVGRLRTCFVAAATLVTAAAVSISGTIGWVGLVIPHVARLAVGPDFSRLLPASLVLGAAFLLAVDTLARSVASVEIPLGILTAIVGAPFFLYLLARGERGW